METKIIIGILIVSLILIAGCKESEPPKISEYNTEERILQIRFRTTNNSNITDININWAIKYEPNEKGYLFEIPYSVRGKSKENITLNNVNITVLDTSQRKLIYYPINYKLDNTLKVECWNDYWDDYSQSTKFNLTSIWFTTDYLEKSNEFTIIKFPEIRTNEVNKIFFNESGFYSCKLKSNLEFDYLEYIDGVLIRNETKRCYEPDLFDDYRFEVRCSETMGDNKKNVKKNKKKKFIEPQRLLSKCNFQQPH